VSGTLNFTGKGILLDIEGTVAPIAFVVDVLFPYAAREIPGYLNHHWDDDDVQAALQQAARDDGFDSVVDWADNSDVAATNLLQAIVEDRKSTGLKAIQGIVWRDGYASGELKATVYDDVPPALHSWRDAGIDVRIYSSGSVEAQNLFFTHSSAGDLLPLLNGFYDTKTGPKRDAASYIAITKAYGVPPSEILFLSDVVQELDAAKAAGCETGLLVRPGNVPVEPGHGHA